MFISGEIVGSDNSALRELTMLGTAGASTLLTMDNVEMDVSYVDFSGISYDGIAFAGITGSSRTRVHWPKSPSPTSRPVCFGGRLRLPR